MGARLPIGALLSAGLLAMAGAQVVGPMVGQTSHSAARFLYRSDNAVQNLRVSVLGADGSIVGTGTANSAAANDFVAKFQVTGLAPNTSYGYRIEEVAGDGTALPVAGGDDGHRFRTLAAPGQRGVFTAAFASCANPTSEPVWERISALNPDALFLMGDTPYIDSSVLATVRQKHRDFLSTPNLRNLIRQVPTVGTWDDHDFGLNNGNGIRVTQKAVNRQVFVEYRANDQFGTGTEGVYFKASCGPMDVFMIDDRWFSQTGPSPVSPGQPTCFGSAQWTWLLDAIRHSTAPFKLLAFGAIWQDKKNSENDDMYTYYYERDALLDFIKEQKIPGVLMLGGDIHVSRHLVHAKRCDYDLQDFVTSPAHTSTIPSLDVYNPDLEWSSQSDRQFLTITVDTRVQPATLVAKFIKHDGTVQRSVSLTYDELIPKPGQGLAKDLRGYWSFDTNLENQSALGPRLNATAVSGASAGASDSVRGGSASFNRAAGQYLKVSRSVLPENSSKHTVSLWAKPATLPAHGSADRAFLLETTPTAAVGGTTGYCISMGIDAGLTSDKVELGLHTYTLKPAAASSGGTNSPTEIAQGPFTVQVDRDLLLNHWTQFAVTFDSTQLQLFINGQAVGSFPLATPGPLSENGGLIIGGHRAGTGRNFDGLIDELAIWSRVLSLAEIGTLWNSGTPAAIPTAVAAVDSDGDSLPDWWENNQQMDPANPADAIADSDGDKVPAFIEYSLGTSPIFDDSAFYQYVRNLVAPGSSAADIAFSNPADQSTGVQLVLESSSDFANWSPVTSGTEVQVLGQLLKLTVPAPGAAQTFYRFQAKAPQP